MRQSQCEVNAAISEASQVAGISEAAKDAEDDPNYDVGAAYTEFMALVDDVWVQINNIRPLDFPSADLVTLANRSITSQWLTPANTSPVRTQFQRLVDKINYDG